MMIGRSREDGDAYAGTLCTMCIDAPVTIDPALLPGASNAPDWLVMLGDEKSNDQIGARWSRVGPRAGDYIARQIGDPALAAPLRANLLRLTLVDGAHPLRRSRAAALARATP